MASIFESHYQDLERWRELCASLQAAIDSLPADESAPNLPKPDPKNLDDSDYKEDLYQELLAGVLKHAEATLRASIHLAKHNNWPELEPEHVYYLRQMMTGSLDFAKQVAVGAGDRHVTIFPFPDMQVAEVFLWMMTEWWLDPGLKAYVARETSDEKIFSRQFDQ